MSQKNTKMISPLQADSPEMRAKRLKRIRNLANLTREEMCSSSDINHNTLISWENGRFGGLTSSGAKKILARIIKEGVHCTLDWLMDGLGPEPSVNPISIPVETQPTEIDEEMIIAYELAVFKAKNHDATDFIVNDEGMLPQYNLGDRVAGKKKFGKDILHTIGYNCIVQTVQGEILFRNVREGKNSSTYTLLCNNFGIKKKSFVLPDVKLLYSAPVIWHRRKDISIN